MLDFEKPEIKNDYSKCLNLLRKLHIIQSEVEYLQKDTKGFNYKYVSGIDVLSKIKPLMKEHKLLLIPAAINQRLEKLEFLKKGEKATNQITVVDFLFTWVDIENGECLEVPFGGQGLSNEDKGFGMACTYAERYFLLKFFHIATDEDDPDVHKEQNQSVGKQNAENVNNVFNSHNNAILPIDKRIADYNSIMSIIKERNIAIPENYKIIGIVEKEIKDKTITIGKLNSAIGIIEGLLSPAKNKDDDKIPF